VTLVIALSDLLCRPVRFKPRIHFLQSRSQGFNLLLLPLRPASRLWILAARRIADFSSRNAVNIHRRAQQNAFHRRAVRVGNPDRSLSILRSPERSIPSQRGDR
jgi:hypothetical protein